MAPKILMYVCSLVTYKSPMAPIDNIDYVDNLGDVFLKFNFYNGAIE